MSYRYTTNAKWTDMWFNSLSPHAKLLFIFLYENCDNAGFYEVNKKFLLLCLGVTSDELKSSILELSKSYIKSNVGNKIWLKNFLKHQKHIPLNTRNKAHKRIVSIIKENLSDEDKFKGCDVLEFLLPDESNEVVIPNVKEKDSTTLPVKKKRRSSRTFTKPTEQEIMDYMMERDFPNAKVEANSFFDYQESIGWKVGNKPMVLWKNAVNTWISKRINPLHLNTFVKPSQQQIIDYMTEMDFPPSKTEGMKFYNWFESNGWKVGKNSMVSWENSVNSWISNWYERNKIVNKSSKIKILQESHEALGDIDWNEVYKDN